VKTKQTNKSGVENGKSAEYHDLPALNEHFTVCELAARWKCCKESVRRDIRSGVLQTIWKHGKHLVPRQEVERVEAESTLPRKGSANT